MKDLQNNTKKYNKYIIRIPKGEETEDRDEEIFEVIVTEDFPKLMTDANRISN